MSRIPLFFLLLLGSTATVWAEAPKSDRIPLIVNYDSSTWFYCRTPDEMTREKLIDFVDRHADLGITHLFFNPNAMRSSFASKSREAIWEHDEKVLAALPPRTRIWPENARLCDERGLDPYTIWIERSREKGISPWISMRMNDMHAVHDPESFLHSQFWKNHPEFRCNPGGAAGLDFAHPEVRQHAMDYVRELLDRYDPDGIELDWMRFPYYFKRSEEEQNGPILTQFMRDVRAEVQKAAKRRGHPILIAARTPVTPEIARKKGIDGVTWAREGLVDILVPSPFWNTADFDIPVESWREALGDAADQVKILPGCEVRLQPFRGSKFVESQGLESVRGFTASALEREADGVYLFNFFDRGGPFGITAESEKRFAEFLSQLSRFEDLPNVRRRHVVTFVDTLPAGVKPEKPLPATLARGEKAPFRLHVGKAPTSGRVLAIIEAKKGPSKGPELSAKLNGHPIALLKTTEAKTDREKNVRYVFSASVDVLKDAYNELTLRGDCDDPCKIVWVELAIEPDKSIEEK